MLDVGFMISSILAILISLLMLRGKVRAINKKSREQLEIRIYKSIVVIIPSAQTVEALRKLDLPAGVDVKIKLIDL